MNFQTRLLQESNLSPVPRGFSPMRYFCFCINRGLIERDVYLLLILRTLGKGSSAVYISREELAKLAGESRRNAQYALKRLIKHGFIRIIKTKVDDQTKRAFLLLSPEWEAL